jgi:hypothetical protein
MSLARLLQFFQTHRFRKELLIALLLKFSLLFLIAGLCFSHPLAKDLTRLDLVKRFLTPSE